MRILSLLIIYVLLNLNMFGQKVTNVSSFQENNDLIIKYDIVNSDPLQEFNVNLYYSVDNGSFLGPLQYVNGDVGTGVIGNGQKIIKWSVLSEISKLEGNVSFKVELIPTKVVSKPTATFVDIDGVVESCVLSGNSLETTLVLTAKKDLSYYFTAEKFHFYDETGVKYYGTTFEWGNQSDNYTNIDLMKDVPFKITFKINEVVSNFSKGSGIQLSDKYDKFKLQFRNIPVEKNK